MLPSCYGLRSSLLEAYGVEKYNQQQIDILKAKTCSNCGEPNKPDAQFCFKCNFVMSFEAYHKGIEESERKDQEIHELKERMDKMGDVIIRLDSSMQFYRNEFMSYVRKFGHPLTDEDRKKIGDAGADRK